MIEFMRRSAAALILSVGLVASYLAFVASSASATSGATTSLPAGPTDFFDCPSGYACFWPFKHFAGGMGKVSGDNPDFRKFQHTTSECHTGTWDNCIESIANRGNSGCTVYWWTGVGYSGRWHSLGAGDGVGDFDVVYNDPSFNDAISSNHWCTPK